jgi:hypothetical protein
VTPVIKAVIAFAVTFVLDVLWARYTLAVKDGRRVQAGVISSLLYLLSAFLVIQYTEDHTMLAPAVLGAFAGTYFGVGKSAPETRG